jgi:hypothetical protein
LIETERELLREGWGEKTGRREEIVPVASQEQSDT